MPQTVTVGNENQNFAKMKSASDEHWNMKSLLSSDKKKLDSSWASKANQTRGIAKYGIKALIKELERLTADYRNVFTGGGGGAFSDPIQDAKKQKAGEEKISSDDLEDLRSRITLDRGQKIRREKEAKKQEARKKEAAKKKQQAAK